MQDGMAAWLLHPRTPAQVPGAPTDAGSACSRGHIHSKPKSNWWVLQTVLALTPAPPWGSGFPLPGAQQRSHLTH